MFGPPLSGPRTSARTTAPAYRPAAGETEESEGPETAAGRKEDYYTFLLIGRDTGGGGNTDTLILVSYVVANDQVNMMSIPRDTAVNVSWSTKKINSVYNASEENGGGIEGLKTQVLYVYLFVIIEWEAVGELVDAVGGVEFDVPRDMNYDDPYRICTSTWRRASRSSTGSRPWA